MKKQRNVTESQKLSDHELEQVYGGISWANYLSSFFRYIKFLCKCKSHTFSF